MPPMIWNVSVENLIGSAVTGAIKTARAAAPATPPTIRILTVPPSPARARSKDDGDRLKLRFGQPVQHEATARKSRQEPAHRLGRAPRHRVAPVGCDLRQWRQHEVALGNAWMGQLQLIAADEPVIVEKIEIEGAGSPAHAPPPSSLALDIMQMKHERVRRHRGGDPGDRVDEARLVDLAEGRSLDKCRTDHKLSAAAIKLAQRMHDCLPGGAPGTRD